MAPPVQPPPFKPSVLRTHRQVPDYNKTTPPYVAAAPITTGQSMKIRRLHTRTVFFVGVGMVAMLAVWLAFQLVIFPFAADTSQHWNYGNSRLSQFDLNVGHDGTSHFIAQYWHQEVIIIEFPAGSAAHAKTYVTPLLIQDDTGKQHSVSLSTAYVNRHTLVGKPDLIVSVSGVTPPIVLYNTGNGFSMEVQ